jgi:hypothetical protein
MTTGRRLRWREAGLCLAALVATAATAAGPEAYRVSAALDTLFDTEGRVVEMRPHEEAEHPAAFWDGLKSRLAALKIPPPQDAAGRPATLRTGLYVNLEVTPGAKGGQVKIAGLDVKPLVLKRQFAGYPQDIAQTAGWMGMVEAECLVGPDGRCGEVKVKALPGMPPSVLRWASATLALWEFQSPQINGVPISVPVHESFSLTTNDDMPVNFLQRGSGNAPFRW